MIRLLLRLTPAPFRERYFREILEVHRLRMADARARGPLTIAKLSVHEVVGSLLLAPRLRLSTRSPHPEPSHGRFTLAFDHVVNDFRISARSLRRDPLFTAMVVVVLALGVGAVTAIFSAVNAYFFRPLPFADEARVVALYETNPEFRWVDAEAAPANALDWREQVDAFEDLAFYSDFLADVTWLGEGEPRLLGATSVSGNFFTVLGVRPLLGQVPQWSDTWSESADLIVLSHKAWATYFGADSSLVGGSIELSGRTLRVAAVMPAGFSFPFDGVDVWGMMGWNREAREQNWFRRAHFVRPLARLAPGVTLEEADAQLQVVVTRLQRDYPETNRLMGAELTGARDFFIRGVRTPLLILSAAVALLLTLACVNITNLMWVRSFERSRDVAVRAALGASRWRIVRHALTESGILGLCGAGLGLMVGWWGVRALAHVNPVGIQGATSLVLDARVVVATVVAALFASLVFGLLPALRNGDGRLSDTLKEGSRGGGSGRSGLRAARLLVGVEVALALVLLLGAGLVSRSFLQIRAVDPGFQIDGVLGVELSIPEARYPDRARVLEFWERFAEMLEARPEIESAGTVARLPLDGPNWSSQVKAEGWSDERVAFEVQHRAADRGYFETLGIPLLQGRLFEASDGPETPNVVVVNESFAQVHFPGENPLGQRIAYDRVPDETSIWYEIVGVVGDQNQVSPAQAPDPEVFEFREQDWSRSMQVVVRSSLDPLTVLPTVRSVLAELDPLVPIADARPLQQVWRRSIAQEERILTLLGIFGVVALLLATVGVYGVTAQAARMRTHEIGVRLALGASDRDIIRMMLRQGLVVIAVGLGVGMLVAVVAAQSLRSLLFEVSPGDPLTLSVALALLAGAALAASYLPARKATRVDPRSSLQTD